MWQDLKILNNKLQPFYAETLNPRTNKRRILMSKKEKLTTAFEISIEGNEFLINYQEIVNTIPETFKNEYEKAVEPLFPIKIDIEGLISKCNSQEEIRKYIYKELEYRILVMVENLLSFESARMIWEYKQERSET